MTVISQTETPGIFRQVVQVNAHTLHADVSVESGGQASAPSPHDYFDAALATCKALTVAVFAKGHDMKLDRVEVTVTRDDSQERQGTYVLNAKLAFFGDLTDEQRTKLLDLSTRCPIHKLMTTRKVEINTAPL